MTLPPDDNDLEEYGLLDEKRSKSYITNDEIKVVLPKAEEILKKQGQYLTFDQINAYALLKDIQTNSNLATWLQNVFKYPTKQIVVRQVFGINYTRMGTTIFLYQFTTTPTQFNQFDAIAKEIRKHTGIDCDMLNKQQMYAVLVHDDKNNVFAKYLIKETPTTRVYFP